jgi:hypothetical protein
VPGNRTDGVVPAPGPVRVGSGPGAMVPDRDPAAEQRALNVLLAGFAAGEAAPPEPREPHDRASRPRSVSGDPGSSAGDDGPTVQFNHGAPTGPASQNVERR